MQKRDSGDEKNEGSNNSSRKQGGLFFDQNSSPIVTLPLGHYNSCGFNCTMNFVWVLYVTVKLISDSQLDDSLKSRFPSVIEIFELFYRGYIDNFAAENRLFELFKITDENWVSRKQSYLNLTIDYLKKSLCVGGGVDGCHVFDWRYEQSWFCGKCKKNSGERTITTSEIVLLTRDFRNTVNESLRNLVQESARGTRTCSLCNDRLRIHRRTLSYPMVLHLSYEASGVHPQPGLPNHLDKVVDFDGKPFDIVGATYYGNSHVKFRYVLHPNVYELEEGPSPDLGDRATSIEIQGDYENALPGSFSDEGEVNYQIHDVFYRRRPAEYQEESSGLKRSFQSLEGKGSDEADD